MKKKDFGQMRSLIHNKTSLILLFFHFYIEKIFYYAKIYK